MNRSKITKQTLKELRGELLAKQNAQKQSNNNEEIEGASLLSPKTNNSEVELSMEHEEEMGM